MTFARIADQLTADFHLQALPNVTRRRVSLPRLPGKVDVVTGMRRAGKSWFLFSEIRALEEQGVARERMLYIDFEDERLARLGLDDLQAFPDALMRRTPSVAEGERWYFFDEIQNVVGWERFVRRLANDPTNRIVVTGSSAKLLSLEIATSLRGRSLATEVLPFGFDEALRYAGIEPPTRWPPATTQRVLMEQQFDRHLDIGGFPEVQDLDDFMRIRVLQEYLDVALFRDVVERHAVTNVPALKALVRRLVASPGGRFSINRFYNDLKSQGLKVGKDTLHAYLDHVEDAGLVGTTRIASESERVRRSNPRKAYVVDHALPRVVTYRTNSDIGHQLENVVYVELRRRGFESSYVISDGGHEVDFLARRSGGPTLLVQVCADPSLPKTRDRELRALEAAAAKHPADGLLVVTLRTSDQWAVGDQRVDVVPAWSWVLKGAR